MLFSENILLIYSLIMSKYIMQNARNWTTFSDIQWERTWACICDNKRAAKISINCHIKQWIFS